MKYLSLFSGVGGFELGIKQAYEILNRQETNIKGESAENLSKTLSRSECDNVERPIPHCIGFSEIDKYATQIYKKHFNHKEYGDITKINEKEVPDFDLLVGGFPCQSFSIAGKRGGFEDTRGTMFFEIARIVREKQPRILLLENVKGLLSHDKGKTFRTIISTLDELGYDCQWQVLNSKNHGVPQNRERVFIVGHLRGTSRPEVFPFGEYAKSSAKQCDEKFQEGEVASTVTATYWKGGKGSQIMMRDGRDNRSCLRAGRTPEVGVKGQSIRRLTPTECERLQGFPDGWTEGLSDTQRYKTMGNAVTVNVIRDIMLKLI